MKLQLLLALAFVLLISIDGKGTEEDMSVDDFINVEYVNNPQKLNELYRKKNRRKLADYNDFIDADAVSEEKCAFNETSYVESRVAPAVKRVLNLFLRYSRLADTNMNEDKSNHFYATLNIQIPRHHLSELQRLFRGEKSEVSLSDLEEYLGNAFYTTKLEMADDFISWLNKKLPWFRLPDIDVNKLPLFTLSYAALIATSALCYKRGNGMWTCLIMFGVGCNLIEATKDYLIEIKKEEIEHYMRLKTRMAYQVECDPARQGVFRRMQNLFWEDPCKQMYLDQQIDTTTRISFMNSFMKVNLITMVQLPLKYIAASVKEMSNELIPEVPFGLGWIVKPFLTIAILIIVLMVLLVFFGGHKMKLYSWFGGIEVGGGGLLPNNERRTPQAAETLQIPAAAAPPPITQRFENCTFIDGLRHRPSANGSVLEPSLPLLDAAPIRFPIPSPSLASKPVSSAMSTSTPVDRVKTAQKIKDEVSSPTPNTSSQTKVTACETLRVDSTKHPSQDSLQSPGLGEVSASASPRSEGSSSDVEVSALICDIKEDLKSMQYDSDMDEFVVYDGDDDRAHNQ